MDTSFKRTSDTPGMDADEAMLSAIGGTRVPIIVFLTDGQPSTGVKNPEVIKRNVRNANREIIPIFSLAFGDDADYNMLKQMSSQNNGIARKIYESSDVTLQMTGFYEEIGTSIMSNVQVKYLDNSIDAASVTAASFQNYFNGTEMIIAGKINDRVPTISLEIDGMGKDGPVTLKLDAKVPRREPSPELVGADDYTGVTEKLWAYLTIKQLMEQMLREDDPAITDSLKKKALELSLKVLNTDIGMC